MTSLGVPRGYPHVIVRDSWQAVEWASTNSLKIRILIDEFLLMKRGFVGRSATLNHVV